VSEDDARRRRKTAADPGRSWNAARRSRCDVREHLERLVESAEAGDLDALQDHLAVIESPRAWLTLDRLDRRAIDRRLRQYAAGDGRWRREP
jgi:hypothetical protein